MPAQDRIRSDHAVAPQCPGQPPHERGEHGPVRPVQAWPWVGAAQDGDLVAQHEELDVLGGGRAARQHDQPEHLPKIKYSNRSDTSGSCTTSDHRWSATQARLLAPHTVNGQPLVEGLDLLGSCSAGSFDVGGGALRPPCGLGGHHSLTPTTSACSIGSAGTGPKTASPIGRPREWFQWWSR